MAKEEFVVSKLNQISHGLEQKGLAHRDNKNILGFVVYDLASAGVEKVAQIIDFNRHSKDSNRIYIIPPDEY